MYANIAGRVYYVQFFVTKRYSSDKRLFFKALTDGHFLLPAHLCASPPQFTLTGFGDDLRLRLWTHLPRFRHYGSFRGNEYPAHP